MDEDDGMTRTDIESSDNAESFSSKTKQALVESVHVEEEKKREEEEDEEAAKDMDVDDDDDDEAKKEKATTPSKNKAKKNIVFRPLYGIEGHQPLCYLLDFEGMRILLDCGWNDTFDTRLLEPLREVAPTVDAIVISFADMEHIGALAYAFAHFALDAPIFATIPTAQMGRCVLEDAYASIGGRSSLDRARFDLAFVDYAISRVVRGGINYLERKMLHINGRRPISFTAFRAGRIVGGSVWKIQSEADRIVYAMDYNDIRDNHLGKSVLGFQRNYDADAEFYNDVLGRPTLLITGANNANLDLTPLDRRVAAFKQDVMKTLRSGGNVLIPIDAGGRALEILLVLHRLWTADNLRYELIFAHRRADMTMDFARRSLEWMHDKIRDSFNANRFNAFDIVRKSLFTATGARSSNAGSVGGSLRLIASEEELRRFLAAESQRGALTNPKVVLATSESLESGFARMFFRQWANDRRNLVCFVSRAFDAQSTIGRALQRTHERSVDIGSYATVALKGDALDAYHREFARLSKLKELQATRRRAEMEAEEEESDDEMVGAVDATRGADGDAASSESEEEDDDEEEDDENENEANDSEDEEDWRSVFVERLASNRPKNAPVHLMYAFRAPRIQMDDYGVKAPKKRDGERPNKFDLIYGERRGGVDPAKILASIEIPPPTKSVTSGVSSRIARNGQDTKQRGGLANENPTSTRRIASNVSVLCRVATHNLEGRSDGAGMRNVVQRLEPRHVIIVHGNREETECMASFVRDNMRSRTQCWPVTTDNRRVEISPESSLVKVALRHDVVDRMRTFVVGHKRDGSDEYVVGNIRAAVETMDVVDSKVAGASAAVGPTSAKLFVVPSKADISTVRGTLRMRPAVFVRRKPLKLSHLQSEISKHKGLRAKLRPGGRLYVNDTVVVARSGSSGGYRVEGVVGEDYFRVRKILYGQYAVL